MKNANSYAIAYFQQRRDQGDVIHFGHKIRELETIIREAQRDALLHAAEIVVGKAPAIPSKSLLPIAEIIFSAADAIRKAAEELMK